MNMLPSKIHDHNNDLDYMLVGDYYLPELKPFEAPPLGKCGRMRLCYLKKHRPCTSIRRCFSRRCHSTTA